MRVDAVAVKCVYFRKTVHPAAGTVALVEYADGTLAVLHNEHAVEGLRWRSERLEDAVAGFTEFQRKLRRREAQSA